MAPETPSSRSRFLLLPEPDEPARAAERAIVRRYSLTRLPAPRVEPPARPAHRPAA